MNNEYRDIRDRIPEPPAWFDEFAVPRYCVFRPNCAANIYAREAALVSIECQACEREFDVCMTSMSGGKIAAAVRDGSLHYGDPPNVECCHGGPSMNCVDRRVLEYWWRDSTTDFEWKRDTSFEIELPQR